MKGLHGRNSAVFKRSRMIKIVLKNNQNFCLLDLLNLILCLLYIQRQSECVFKIM